ncbi:hypothetical protein Tco_0611580 [Tanacetum coccineum]
MDLLFEASLLEAAHLKKVLKKSKQDTHMLHASGSSEGANFESVVLDEPKDSEDDDDDSDNDVDDDVDSNADGDNEVSDSEKTDLDDNENLTLKMKDDEEEEYVHTPKNYESSNDDDEHVDEEEYEELYKDVNVKLKDPEHEEERKRDAEMTDAGHDDATQETSYKQVIDDAHVTLTGAHVIQKTKGPMQSSSVSSDFVSQFLHLDNTPPADNEVVSMMNVKIRDEEPNFSSLFRFDQRVSAMEKELSLFKQVDYSAQLLKTIKSYTVKFKKKAQDEKKRYINLIEKSVKEIIKDEVNTQLPQILPKQISDFATPLIQSTITESLENVVLAKYSSQPQSTYKAATSLTEFELKKILLDKMQKSKSYRGAQQHKELYDEMVKSYKLDKDLFESYEVNLGPTEIQPNVDAAIHKKHDWFMKPEIPSTPNPDWNARKFLLIFSKGHVEVEWKSNNISKNVIKLSQINLTGITLKDRNIHLTLPLIEDRGCQVVPVEYFFSNDLEYLKGGSSSRKYMTSITKTKAASITDVYQTYCHSGACGRSSTGSRKLLEEAQYHQARDIQFSDGTLTSVRDVLHDIAANLRMDYLPKGKWSNLDRKRYRMMIKAINKLLFEGRLMRSLEKLVGRRDYRNDLKLLEWTI